MIKVYARLKMKKFNFYDFKMPMLIHEVSLNLDTDIKRNIENFLSHHKDEMNHTTNVKANSTNWTTHKTNKDIFALSEIVLKIANDIKTLPLYTSECWGVIYNNGEKTIQHNHFPFLWSWCYYVKTPIGSSPLVFPDAKIIYEPKEDELIIFPSLCDHLVPPCSCEEKRIMVAGNIGLERIN